MDLLEALNLIDEDLWYVGMVLIAIMGIIATAVFVLPQITKFKSMCKVTFRDDKDKNRKGLSSFQAFCLSMGSRIGVGNITGPVLAILTGGPGAIFWMWIFAFLGMASSLLETTVGQIFKTRNEDGIAYGGPAYYITKGLNAKRLGIIVGIIMVLMYALGFVSMEVDSMTEAFCHAFDFEMNKVTFAIIITAVAGLIILGGVKKMANICTKIVPIMAIIWVIICVAAIVLLPGGILNAFGSIFEYAFNMPAVIGGGFGIILVTGMTRGIMSNEAGIGTITNVSAMADVKHPVSQGLSQSLGVLIDALICTLTALVVLSFGSINDIVGLGLESSPTLQAIFGEAFGSSAVYIIMVFMILFALTSMLSDIIISCNNLKLLSDTKTIRIALYVFILAVVFISAFYASDELYAVVDIMLVLCAFVNVYAMIRLGKLGLEAFRDYMKQKADGIEEPVFTKDVLSKQDGITEWGSAEKSKN